MANNPKIYYTDLSKYTIANVSEATTTTANLLNYFTDEMWISPNNNNQTLTIKFSTIKTCNYFLLDPFISYGNTAKLGLTAADDQAMSVNSVTIINNMSLDIITPGPLIVDFTSQAKQYWKMSLSGLTTLSPSGGNIWIDNSFSFTTPYDYGYSKEDAQYATNEFTALNGKIRTSQKYAGRLLYDLKFSLQDNTLRTNFQTFIKAIRGKLRPFYFADIDLVYVGSPVYINAGTIRYMHVDSDYTPLTTRFYGKHDIGTLKMKTKYAAF